MTRTAHPTGSGAVHPGARDAARLDAMVSDKAAAEVAAAEALAPGGVAGDGPTPADVLLLKGSPSEADLAAGKAMAGVDGEASAKALAAMGWEGAAYRACTRPDGTWDAPRVARLRLLVEAIDPDLVLALDTDAARDLAEALGTPPLGFGRPMHVGGRSLLAVDGFEASLSDQRRKRRVWSQMKKAARP